MSGGLVIGINGGALVGSNGGGFRAGLGAVVSDNIVGLNVANTEASTSSGFIQFGQGFAMGDIPSGYIPKVTYGGTELTNVQFDRRVTYPDGSLKYAKVSIRTTDFTSLEDRDLVFSAIAGSYDNTASFTLANVTAASDWKADLTNVKKFTDTYTLNGIFNTVASSDVVTIDHTSHGLSTGDLVYFKAIDTTESGDRVSGLTLEDETFSVTYIDANSYSITANDIADTTETAYGADVTVHYSTDQLDIAFAFNTASATATRVFKTCQGPVYDEWEVWEANDGLVAVWQVGAYNDGSDTVNGNTQCSLELALPYIDQADKGRFNYDLALKEDVTTFYTYTDVAHHYHGAWVAARMDDDAQHMLKYYQTEAQRPTLLVTRTSDQLQYLTDAKLLPPMDYTFSGVTESTAPSSYTPMVTLGIPWNQTQSEGPIRGVMSRWDAEALMSQTEARIRRMRIHSIAGGMHPGGCYLSKANRTRSGTYGYNDFTGEGTDVATSVPVAQFDTLPVGYSSDFTGDGLPTEGYIMVGTSNATYNGGLTSYLGGTGEWNIDNSGMDHGYGISTVAYLLEGESHQWRACKYQGMKPVLFTTESSGNGRPYLLNYGRTPRQTAWSIPGTRYSHTSLNHIANYRHNAWAAVSLAGMVGLCPDDDIEKTYFNTILANDSNFLSTSISYFPQSYIDTGLLYERSGNQAQATFMDAFCTVGLYHLYGMTRDAGILEAAEMMANFQVNLLDKGTYWLYVYRVATKYRHDNEDPSAILQGSDWLGGRGVSASVTAETDLVEAVSGNLETISGAGFVDTDVAYFRSENGIGNTSLAIPTEVSQEVAYYVVDSSGANQVKVETSIGAGAINFETTVPTTSIWFRHSNLDQTVVGDNGFIVPSGDSQLGHNIAALCIAYQHGHTNLSLADMQKLDTFRDNAAFDARYDDNAQWRFTSGL